MIELTIVDGEKIKIKAQNIKSVKSNDKFSIVETQYSAVCVTEDIFTIMQMIVNSYFEGGNS